MAISFQQTRTVEAVQQGKDSRNAIEAFVSEAGYVYLEYDKGAPFAGMLYRRSVGEGDTMRMLVDYGDLIVKVDGKLDNVVDAKGLRAQYSHTVR